MRYKEHIQGTDNKFTLNSAYHVLHEEDNFGKTVKKGIFQVAKRGNTLKTLGEISHLQHYSDRKTLKIIYTLPPSNSIFDVLLHYSVPGSTPV